MLVRYGLKCRVGDFPAHRGIRAGAWPQPDVQVGPPTPRRSGTRSWSCSQKGRSSAGSMTRSLIKCCAGASVRIIHQPVEKPSDRSIIDGGRPILTLSVPYFKDFKSENRCCCDSFNRLHHCQNIVILGVIKRQMVTSAGPT